jgi:glyoxylase-like metal-dependent hydrolase (beta-lactamase superfamily II)
MLTVERYGDVTRLRFSTAASRALGYDASAYAVRRMLVDTGFPDVARDLATWLDAERPTGVIVTHQHEDHAGNAELVAARGIPMTMPEATLRVARDPAPLGFYRRLCWGSPAPLRSPLLPFSIAPLELIPSPGHCADHHVVWDAERGTLFAADLYLGVKVRVAQSTERVPALAQSLRDAIALAPERMFCSHRGLVQDPVGQLRAKLQWLEWLMGETARLRAAGRTDAQIARELLGPEGFLPVFSGGELSKRHLIEAIP